MNDLNKDTQERKCLLQKLKQTFGWFEEFCSWSGISQYRISDNKISKSFWLALYWLGLCLTLLLVKSSINRLLSHPFTTKVERTNNFAAQFPSVTICNPNRIHCKRLLGLIQTCSRVREIPFISSFRLEIFYIAHFYPEKVSFVFSAFRMEKLANPKPFIVSYCSWQNVTSL